MRAYRITSNAIARERERAQREDAAFDVARVLELVQAETPALGRYDVRVRVLAVTAEYNMVHAALADPIDIAAARGGSMQPGNNFVGEVVEVGDAVRGVDSGAIVSYGGASRSDSNGFPLRAWGFDDDLDGCCAEEIVLPAHMVRELPLECGLNLWELAAATLRSGTAYHLWRRGLRIFRAKVPAERLARLNVLAFGGGVSEMFLMLARSEGHRTVYCAGSAPRRARMEAMGVETVDQHAFGRFRDPSGVEAFHREMKKLTGGAGFHVVCDMFRGDLFQAGVAVMARGGVNVSAGWQLDTRVEYNSALFAVRQLTLDHAHMEMDAAVPAVYSLYGSVFRPPVHSEVYDFEDLPRAVAELHAGVQQGFPVIRVASEMPASVRGLIPEAEWGRARDAG